MSDRLSSNRMAAPPRQTPPDMGPPFEPLVKPWIRAFAGGTMVGLLIGAALGVAIAAVKLNVQPPPPVSTAPIVVPSQFAPFPIRSPGVLGPIVKGRVGTFDATGVTFDYPENWQNMTRVVAAHPPHGHAIWNAVLGTGQSQVAVVSAYRATDPGSGPARHRQASLTAQDVAEQLGATFAGTVGDAGARPLPTFGYSMVGASLHDRPPWRVDAFVLFGPHTRYVVQCQSLGADPTEFTRGCAQIMSTFRTTGRPVGASTPLAAARALYQSAKAGRADLAHRVATDEAAKALPTWEPDLQPPTTCVVSDGASGQLCGPKDADLFSVEFEVAHIGDRWVVTHVFRCTQYGSEVICRTFGP